MKKLFTSLAVGALLVASIPSTASAATPNYAACIVENCNVSDIHQHDGLSYVGHTIGDGHSYHQVCGVSNCTQTGTHDHNGDTYFAHHNNDGHTYHTEQHNNGGGHNRHNGGRHH